MTEHTEELKQEILANILRNRLSIGYYNKSKIVFWVKRNLV